jgi:hypothetical protein
MIRNAVIHILNEQPLMADLLESPSPPDAVLICTNLRTMNGMRPVFIDDVRSVFVFPLAQIRFIEIPPGSRDEAGPPVGGSAIEAPPAQTPAAPEPDADLEIDEDFLRRVREV